MKEILPFLLGGLALFLYAVRQLSETLKDIFSEKAKNAIERYTRSLFSSILVGVVITMILDSSSAVIILTIIFINSGSLNFKQAIGIIMGANIGTTFSSQIIALDVAKYSVYILLIGLMLELISKSEMRKRTGRIILYFGMLFFGLFVMERSVLPLRESELFETWITSLENPFQGALFGGLITLIIQSSSATMGMVIVLGKQQLISISAGIAVMLGAELGTCSDTLIATINGSCQALKAGLFHLLFNLITIALGLILFHPFVELVETLSGDTSLNRLIANAHMFFNTAGVILFIPLVPLVERLLNKVLPEKKLA